MPPGHAEVTELRYQGSANNVSLPELAEDLGYLGDVKLKWVGNTTSGPAEHPVRRDRSQTDFGGAFSGAVVKLIEAGAPVTAVDQLLRRGREDVQRLLRHGGQPDPDAAGPDRQEDRRQHPGRPSRTP